MDDHSRAPARSGETARPAPGPAIARRHADLDGPPKIAMASRHMPPRPPQIARPGEGADD